MDDCELGQDDCDDNAECVSTPYGHRCQCMDGYSGYCTQCQGMCHLFFCNQKMNLNHINKGKVTSDQISPIVAVKYHSDVTLFYALEHCKAFLHNIAHM